jgi:hypothetical protein
MGESLLVTGDIIKCMEKEYSSEKMAVSTKDSTLMIKRKATAHSTGPMAVYTSVSGMTENNMVMVNF